MIAAFLTTVLFAVSAVSGRRTSRLLGGTEAHFWRLAFATLLLALYAHLVGPGTDSVAFGIFLVSGAIGFGVGDLALFQALPRIGSRLSMMMVMCLASPVAVVAEWTWIGTRLSLLEMVSGALILVGVAAALAPEENPHIPRRKLYPGMFFGFVAAVCQAAGAVLSRHGFDVAAQAQEHLNGVVSAYQRIVGGLMVTAVCLLLVKRSQVGRLMRGQPTGGPGRKRAWRCAWPWVLLNGLAGPALGVSCYQWALQTTPTGIVLPIVALTPLVVIPLALLLEGERPTGRSLLGAIVAVSGAACLAWSRSH